MADFAKRYYTAVYAFIRAIVRDEDAAQDLTQAFFHEKVLRSRRVLTAADARRGPFRPFLKQTIRNFIVDIQRDRARLPQPTQRVLGYAHPAFEPGDNAEDALLREWGRTIVQIALARVEAHCQSRGQHEHFSMFVARYLEDTDRPASFRAIGALFGLDEKSARGRVETVRRQFRTALRELITTDQATPADADEEIRKMAAVL